jgi:hypothetical protein
MAIEIDVRIIGETSAKVVEELGEFATFLAWGLGNKATPTNTHNTAEEKAPPTEKPNGADTPTKAAPRAKKVATPPAGADLKAVLDRAAIIDGLTKIYSKGDEDVRLAITKFRDGQGADRLRDLKDDALPAAAELLTELKLSADSPQV